MRTDSGYQNTLERDEARVNYCAPLSEVLCLCCRSEFGRVIWGIRMRPSNIDREVKSFTKLCSCCVRTD